MIATARFAHYRKRVFFARGSTSAFDDEEKKNVFDARDIAQGVFTKLGSDASTAELAKAWAEQIKFFYEKRPVEFARSAVDGLMTDGFFVGMAAGGSVTFSGQSIRYRQRDKARFFATPEPVVFSDPSAGPKYVSGYQDLIREFRSGGKTKRAKTVLSRLDPAQRGLDAVAARYSAFVRAVRDWTGDKGIGGDIATIILERGKGWRWFIAPISARKIEDIARADASGLKLLRDASDTMRLSARGYHRVLRVARTIADLDGAEAVGRRHIAEALSYRALADDVCRAA